MDNNNYQYEEPPYKTLEEALNLAMKAVQGEKEDEMFYDYLISVAPTKEEKEIISAIRDDEMKHNKMFREIYYYFTGEELPQNTRAYFEEPKDYISGVKKAFFGELAAMERYRIIRAGLPSEYYRDMVFEILTDEMKHADKYNYILNLNLEDKDQVGAMQTTTPKQGQSNQMKDNQDQNGGNETNPKETNPNENDQMVTMDELKKYIEPLVEEAMREVKAGTEIKSLFQKYILIGILIGNGFSSDQSMEQVRAWEKYI
ncbi:MAG: rubrerythrin [Firmicutes bacterium]|nr:rubrerythrin [Bacillota bacterium]